MATATIVTAIPSNEKYSKEMEALKKEARRMLLAAASTKLMILIDKFERLGLAYHFETEIENKLKQVYDSIEGEQDYDLFTTALRFRLLRQHQYHVSCKSPIKEKVEQALKRSIHKGLPLLNVRFYISVYGRDASTEEFLVKLAKLNFNFLQNIYRKELAELTRWNLDEIDVLPDFMKVVYRFIMSIYEDFERDAEKLGKSFAVPYYRETVKQLGRAYNQEQKWIMERQMPPFEEYMTNSVFTSCIYVMFMAFVPGMKSVTEEVVQWLLSEPKIVISTAKMGRTLEDLGSHERENREGKLPTVVDCYMNDKGVSKQEALSQFVELVEDGWKDMTEEWVKAGGRSAPNELIQQLLNYGGAAEVTYNNKEDGYTDPEKYLGPLIAALYVDPILI
ncbi:hypothetical protein C2S51_021046 [Perilla frutescens var. frutescens]|nr:hypothetical protein C2S51_021046 [Perilla frutescens var. frutescens]